MARRWLGALAAALILAAPQARASGPGETAPWYLDQFGGDHSDLAKLYDGRLGIVMATSPRPQLYIAWRLLHGQKVGPAAGLALSTPCCDPPKPADQPYGSEPWNWLTARKQAPGAPELDFLQTDREGPNYTSIETCFDDAFKTATNTLAARIQSYGAKSPDVAAWLAAQDAVFKSCHDTGVVMPPLEANAPAWLRADYAYQTAAKTLYDGRYDDAEASFASIAADRDSPWRGIAPYLEVRTAVRAAIAQKTPEAYAKAHKAIDSLAAQPPGAIGQGDAWKMRRVLEFREDPEAFMTARLAELSTRDAAPDIAVSFRDISELYDGGETAEALDWMSTLRAKPNQAAMDKAGGNDDEILQAHIEARRASQAHALERWRRTSDQAWLLVACALTDEGAPETPQIVAAAARIAPTDPAWASMQYHLIRLTLRSAPAASTRARLDGILARGDLSVSDRNIFTAQRLQLATNRRDFARLALRRRLCANEAETDGCVRRLWQDDSYQRPSIYDGEADKGTQGFGADALAIIDRLPLADRIALSRDTQLPAPLRLDLALTSFARAVALNDKASETGLAHDLETLLPQMKADWRRVETAPPGPARRFDVLLILAKIPGLRFDIIDYARPEGSIEHFQGYWLDWILASPGQPNSSLQPPDLARYQVDGRIILRSTPDNLTDLSCLGECSTAPAPLRLPDFAATNQAKAAKERGYFVAIGNQAQEEDAKLSGTVSAWDQILSYAQSHPSDPQAPEALYWLVEVGRFGGSHNHCGHRAFQLLHARYPDSPWAAKARYYYD